MTAPPAAPPSRKVWPYVHALLVACGTGGATFLTATFATGLPTTQAAWRALLIGTIAAALSRLFGVVVAKLGP